MRGTDDLYNVTEFYKSGEVRPFARRSGIASHPRPGDRIDAFGVTGEVSSVVWNMDYHGEPGEQWRCNIYIIEGHHQ